MRITASHIVNWVNTRSKEAQGELSRLVRRLCFNPDATRHISFPAGDSTFMPGFDGIVEFDGVSAWVPKGTSGWEIGCEKEIKGKAVGDYTKRTGEISAEVRAKATFVFVTPRRWKGKAAWLEQRRAEGSWADVRAYDADDLEQWLEQSPVVALQFADELGLTGWGMVTLERYWASWSTQCAPTITEAAFLLDRDAVRNELIGRLQQKPGNNDAQQVVGLQAESVEEAVAFSAAVLSNHASLACQAVVITAPEAWRIVETNPAVRIAIAASTELAAIAPTRNELTIIAPYARGELGTKSAGITLTLPRQRIHAFKEALVTIGLDEADSHREALLAGRSWTVFRRQHAINPAIRHPAWIDHPAARSLSLICLIGAWHSNRASDCDWIATIAKRDYEEIERDLQQLASLDDAPILHIGSIWKARSPLELLNLCAGRITRDELNRFFEAAEAILSSPDPKLELPENQRWMAAVHGKVHPFSAFLVEAICDTLVKLAVHDDAHPQLRTLAVAARINHLVHTLLHGADPLRWLSLASYLPKLAEASPDSFLKAVEQSLAQAEPPVVRLILETSSSGIGGRCWHSGLLWALEILAWAPNRLSRVALILARLSHVPVAGNWGNTAANSLLGLFRAWWPQTSACLAERLKVLTLLIQRDADRAFNVLIGLVNRGPQMAQPAACPSWRDDDAGTHGPVAQDEIETVIRFASDQIIQLSTGHTQRISALMHQNVCDWRAEHAALAALLSPYESVEATDDDREALRSALRPVIHWHRNYDDTLEAEGEAWLRDLEAAYDAIAPSDLLHRHRWLFEASWLDLPEKHVNEQGIGATAQVRRNAALNEIYGALGLEGIAQLIEQSAESWTVGWGLAQFSETAISWPKWLLQLAKDPEMHGRSRNAVRGFLAACPTERSTAILQAMLALDESASPEDKGRLLVLARVEHALWKLAEHLGPDVKRAYWTEVPVGTWRVEANDMNKVIQQLLDVDRPSSALVVCQFDYEVVEPPLLFEALWRFAAGDEPHNRLIQSWHIAKMIEFLEASDGIDKERLVQLEFGLFPLLRLDKAQKAISLFSAITTDPAHFIELLCILFKPRHGERTEPVTENLQAAAETAWDVFRACRRLPGTRDDGTIDAVAITQFVDELLARCRDVDRLEIGAEMLGQILAHAPADDDRSWPCLAVREVLERPELEDMRRGFRIGVFNKRGATWRSPTDGGEQERELSRSFAEKAAKIQHTHPLVASVLEDLSAGYLRDAHKEDIDARLNEEDF